MNFSTIPELYHSTCKKNADKIAYKYKNENVWVEISYSEFMNKVECLAVGLMDLGLHKGDRIGLVSENRIEWIISAAAISMLGAIDVPLFPNTTPKQEEAIFNDCQATAVIVSNNFQLNKILEIKENVSSIRHIIVMNEKISSEEIYVKKWNEIIDRGASLKITAERKNLLQAVRAKISQDDIVTLIYTSGTTGDPKGVMLTNKNLISNCIGSINSIKITKDDTAVSYLPLCHSFERMVTLYVLFAIGTTTAITASLDTLITDVAEIKPTFMTTVPKFLDTVKKKIFAAMNKESLAKRKIFDWAISVGLKYAKTKLNNKSLLFIQAQYNLAYKLVLNKLREKLGGNLNQFISGGAALSSELTEFYEMLGISCLQGYGLTETSPVVSVCRYGENEAGTIGKPLPNVEVKIAEDGELLVRAPSVMKGYWNNPLATSETIDTDGWLYTGDVATWSKHGNLKITDRKKYIFVNNGGKNIVPQPIETILTQSKYIEQCVLIGDNREYCTAILTPNYDEIKLLADGFSIQYENEEELLRNDKILSHVKRDIDYLQRDFSKFERVRKFQFLHKPFSIETGELSPKLSVKRHVVEQKYRDLIELMYGEE